MDGSKAKIHPNRRLSLSLPSEASHFAQNRGFTAPGSFKLHLPEGDLRTYQAVNESILAGVLREEQLEQPYTPLLPTFPAARGVGAQRKASGGSVQWRTTASELL